MSCCQKDKAGNKGCQKHNKEQNGCCDNGMCNPMLLNCSLCMALGVVPQSINLLQSRIDNSYHKIAFPQIEQHLISQYRAKMLRPPEMS